jgi:hypothetical protein
VHAGQAPGAANALVHFSPTKLAACSMKQRAFTSAKSMNDIAALLLVMN